MISLNNQTELKYYKYVRCDDDRFIDCPWFIPPWGSFLYKKTLTMSRQTIQIRPTRYDLGNVIM